MKENVKRPPLKRMPRRGPGAHGPGMPAEKPKEFKKTLVKTLKYMRKNLAAVIIAFVLAIGGVVATLLVPDIMGQATDELLTGVLRAQIYKTVKTADALVTEEMASAAETTPDMPLVQWLAQHPQDLPQEQTEISQEELEEMAHITIGQMVRAHSKQTLGEYMAELGMSEAFDKLPAEYSDAVYHTSLTQGEPGVDVDAVVHTLTLTLILVCVSGALSYGQGFILATVAQSVSYRFRRDIYAKIDKLPLKYFPAAHRRHHAHRRDGDDVPHQLDTHAGGARYRARIAAHRAFGGEKVAEVLSAAAGISGARQRAD